MTKRIELHQGKYTLVDDEDYEWLSQWRWSVNTRGYVSALIDGHRIGIHRVIMQAKQGESVDHITGDTLDNQRTNLRVATHRQNSHNQRKPALVATSRFKGVSRESSGHKWLARIRVDYQLVSLGYFEHEIDAARAYDTAAREHFGEFACVNFPVGSERSALYV